MTRSLSHRITAISMALLMILSSTGFSMDIHFCQNQLKSVSLLGKAKSCHKKQETPPCHEISKSCHHKKDGINKADKDNCCHNETFVIEKSDLNATPIQLTTFQDIQLDFVSAFIKVYVYHYSVPADFLPYTQHKPPLPDRDVQVLYQIFLI